MKHLILARTTCTCISQNDSSVLHSGLANRVVPKGQSLEEAIALAEQLSSFPQQCLRTDRNSALRSAPGGNIKQLLAQEYSNGMEVIVKGEATTGARKFVEGDGRHGDFHIQKENQ